MRMQTEGESPMELNALLPQQHVACGGAARTLDVKKLTEAWKRGRVETEAESEIDGELRAASTMGRFEAAREDAEVDARRRAMRRRVIASLALAAVATAALCWEYPPRPARLARRRPGRSRVCGGPCHRELLGDARHKHRAGAARVSSR